MLFRGKIVKDRQKNVEKEKVTKLSDYAEKAGDEWT